MCRSVKAAAVPGTALLSIGMIAFKWGYAWIMPSTTERETDSIDWP
jgi:hypothetical protein